VPVAHDILLDREAAFALIKTEGSECCEAEAYMYVGHN
jgi:hypothetical protein